MRALLVVAAALQVAALLYCALLLRRYRNAPIAWLCLLGVLSTMLVWRVVMATGAAPGPVFNTSIAIGGSVCAVLAMFFFGREMTRRERAEAERDQLLASERAARGDAERANRIKDDFMGTLSHELRSPLAAILGWCAIARQVDGSPEVGRALDTIERNARLQTRLVDDLLDATRLQTGSLHLDFAPVALDVPVLAAIEGVRPTAEQKGVALRYVCTDPPPIVDGDAGRLQQIASNLLVNAVKFTPSGERIEVSIRAAGDHAELTVRDHGIGIEPGFVPQLFQRFSQADSRPARRSGGVGLGLSIVSSLVRLHQGEVEARSDGPGTGACFVVRLALSDATAVSPPVEPDDPATLLDSASPLRDVRVVIVDDESDVRAAVTRLLERSGATVLALESGASIDVVLAGFRPDVLVLDIGMPGEDGYMLIQRIRQLSPAAGGETPAVSLTAHAREQDRQHAIALGFQAHLAKPVNVPLLVDTIRTLLRKPAAARGL